MDIKTKAVGRSAAVVKYDLITAICTWGMSGSKHDQRLALRFVALITARYNWQRQVLAVGQREIAALWNCTERTVKRDMAKLRAMCWIRVRMQGRRGRVAEYCIDLDKVFESTRPVWSNVGPDFVHRVDQSAQPDNVVPLVPNRTVAAPEVSSGSVWALACALIHEQDPAAYASWVRSLNQANRAGGRLTLLAPSRFHAAYVETHLKALLLSACQSVDDEINEISIVS